MKKKANSTLPSCAEKSQPFVAISPAIKEDDIDRQVFSQLISHIPDELKDQIYRGGGLRALRFRKDNSTVTIICPPDVRTWLESNADILNPILANWVGQAYSGYDFINTNTN